MNSKKVFYGMIGVVILLGCLIIATTFMGDKILRRQSEKLVSLKLDNEIIDTQQTSLAQAKTDIKKYSNLKDLAKQIVPQEKDQARVTREIVNIAADSGVKISSITFPASNLGQTKPGSSAPATSTGVTQVKPVESIKGLYQLDINVVSDSTQPISYQKLIDFLGRLEQNRRTAQVSQISIQPDVQDRAGLNFNLTVTVYIKP